MKVTGSDRDDYTGAYRHYAGVLRTWLVAYGVGGPVIILTNDKLWEAMQSARILALAGSLFLLGVALQVLLALLNKTTMWLSYYGQDHEEFKKSRRYAAAKWLRSKYLIDFVSDVGSILLFAGATVVVFLALLESVP